MIRLCIAGLLLGWGYHAGSWWGLYSMLLLSGVVLPLFTRGMNEAQGQRHQTALEASDEAQDVPARRGRRIDPTRPNHEDYAAMITDNFKGRKHG